MVLGSLVTDLQLREGLATKPHAPLFAFLTCEPNATVAPIHPRIAFATGVKSQSHFASAFKSRMGVSLRELPQATFASDPEGADLQGSRKRTAY